MLRLREVLPVEAGDEIARVGEIWFGRIAGVIDVPAHVVAVQMSVRDDVDILGACALRADGIQQVAPDIAAVCVRAGAHAGVHHDGLAHGADEEVTVVQLYLTVFEDVPVRLPVCCGHAFEEGVGRSRRRDHVEREDYFGIADADSINHKFLREFHIDEQDGTG